MTRIRKCCLMLAGALLSLAHTQTPANKATLVKSSNAVKTDDTAWTHPHVIVILIIALAMLQLYVKWGRMLVYMFIDLWTGMFRDTWRSFVGALEWAFSEQAAEERRQQNAISTNPSDEPTTVTMQSSQTDDVLDSTGEMEVLEDKEEEDRKPMEAVGATDASVGSVGLEMMNDVTLVDPKPNIVILH